MRILEDLSGLFKRVMGIHIEAVQLCYGLLRLVVD